MKRIWISYYNFDQVCIPLKMLNWIRAHVRNFNISVAHVCWLWHNYVCFTGFKKMRFVLLHHKLCCAVFKFIGALSCARIWFIVVYNLFLAHARYILSLPPAWHEVKSSEHVVHWKCSSFLYLKATDGHNNVCIVFSFIDLSWIL